MHRRSTQNAGVTQWVRLQFWREGQGRDPSSDTTLCVGVNRQLHIYAKVTAYKGTGSVQPGLLQNEAFLSDHWPLSGIPT